MASFSRDLNPQQDLDPVEFDTAVIAHPEASRAPGSVTSTLQRGGHLYIAATKRWRIIGFVENGRAGEVRPVAFWVTSIIGRAVSAS